MSEAERYLTLKREEGYRGMSFLHLFIAAYVHAVAMRPGINRFVAGQRVYSRDGIHVVMSAKRALSADASETMIKMVFEPTDTLFDVYRKVNEKVDSIMAEDGESAADRLAGTLLKIPGILLKFAIWLFNFLDYFDWLPRSLLSASPFHGSMALTDMSSLSAGPSFHHLYNFGNLPVYLSFGAKRREYEPDAGGLLTERKYVDYTAVLDERTCDGYYYSSAFKYFKHYINNPQLLEIPPEKVEQDVF